MNPIMLVSLSVDFFVIWLVVPAASIAGGYSGSKRKGKPFFSAGEMVILLLLISFGSFALFVELAVTGTVAYYFSNGQQPFSQALANTVFVLTLSTLVILFGLYAALSYWSWKHGRAELSMKQG